MITVAALAAVALTTSLGVWQWRRAEFKRALLAQQQAQQSAQPLNWQSLREAAADGTLDTFYGRMVRLRGRWVPGTLVWLDNRPRHGQAGWIALTALRAPEGETAVVVQRGWLPRPTDPRRPAPSLATPEGEDVEVLGRLAPPPSKLWQLGSEAPGPIRQNIDLGAAAVEWNLPLMPVSVQQTEPVESTLDGVPLQRDWPVVAVPPEKHVGYAVQWFALAGLIVALYVWFQILLPRRRRIPLAR
ncbi:SURF1 family protein [Tepidimonas alkaliphilus]|uniref:SURF1 family protein n=1 Tax=Tepidimonas alkaliphilus TaxID=2588942 RepID=UPI00163D46DF|nr:SURF1 family protein [Tepidimonas alkaliphilus]